MGGLLLSWIWIWVWATEGKFAFALLLVVVDRLPCFRPARLVSKYSQAKPRFAQRVHVGFSRLHLILDAAQLLQVLRSLRPVGEMLRRGSEVAIAIRILRNVFHGLSQNLW